MSVWQLRHDTQRYAPRLQARAACVWHAWLNKVLEPENRPYDTRLPTGEYGYGFALSGAALEAPIDEGGESG